MAIQVPPNCDLTLGLTRLAHDEVGVTSWRTTVDERFLNPAGVVQGGFFAAVLDSAMGASAVSAAQERKVTVANAEMKVSFMRSARPGDVLTCTARVRQAGRTITFVEAEIVNDGGDVVATASSTYVVRDRSK